MSPTKINYDMVGIFKYKVMNKVKEGGQRN